MSDVCKKGVLNLWPYIMYNFISFFFLFSFVSAVN